MAFTFLHAADLHLGSPLTGLALKDEEVARRFAAASREAFSDLVTHAIEAEVAFVVIAGDVYDGEWKDTSIGLFFNREVARLDRAGIPLFLLKGNHDAESVVTKTISLPDSVVQFPTTRAKTFRIEELNVALHGRSFPDRVVNENYALSYPDPVPGWFNIGVLHTSCDGRPGHATYAPCTVAELASRGYQYWALGHVHEFEELARDPRIVYPGNLQGRSVRECGPKGAVLVDVADGHVSQVRRLIVDRARWAVVRVYLDGISEESVALRKIEDEIRPAAEQADGRLLALRVRLEGTTALHRRLKADPRRFSDEVQAAAHRCSEDIWLEVLRIETLEPHAAAASDDPIALLDLAATLEALQHDSGLRTSAAALISDITGKLPGGIATNEAPLVEDLDALLNDARALVLGRAMSQPGR
jgi:DNA repair exonuclease SbcCD nuclease subunit